MNQAKGDQPNLTSLGYGETTESVVLSMLGDSFDFTRCQRPSGKVYGTRFKCRPPAVEIGAKEAAEKASKGAGKQRGMRVGKNVRNMGVEDLQKLLDDPRVKPHQAKKIQDLIDSKGGATSKETAASRVARPVDPKVAAKVDKALKAKAKGPGYTPEQLAAQDALLKKSKGRSEAQLEERGKFRREVQIDRNILEMNLSLSGSGRKALDDLKSRYATMQSLYKDPSFQTPANRSRMIGMRLAIWERERQLREKENRPVSADVQQAVQASPKHSSTPGSVKPIRPPAKGDLPKLEEEFKALSKEFDKLNRNATSEKQKAKLAEVASRLMDVGSKVNALQDGRPPSLPSLQEIYKEQGFDAKPELVARVADLRARNDVLKGSDGKPIIMYRGVTTTEFSDQFKGIGPNGEVHFAGRGIHGNGTYAAAASDTSPGTTQDAPLRTARGYAGNQENLNSKVTAFAVRSDARIATFPGQDRLSRDRAYDKWYDDTMDEARKVTGYNVKDLGEAAAALGYHGYQVPQRGEDYYVILNRGAVIAAMESGVD